MPIQRICVPTRPQPDTIVAIFLIRTFGKERFPGADSAPIEIKHQLPEGETFETLLEKGTLAIDVGGGPFDHHGKDLCTSELVAHYLGVQANPALARLIAYARRDDVEGKGTISTDPIDRSFGLSGLIASLNKQFVDDPNLIVETVLPLIAAHYHASYEHHVALPREVEDMKKNGTYQEAKTKQGTKNLKIAFVVSDKPSMSTYLRSQQGPQADVIVQKLSDSNHFCVLTKQERKIDLSRVMALIRLREAQLQGIDLPENLDLLTQTGRLEGVEYWYFDPATNSLLNGSAHNRTVRESRIEWEEFKNIVQAGLGLET